MYTAVVDFPLPIITPRLVLRQPAIAGAYQYFQAVTESKNELAQWLPWAKYSISLMQAEQYIKECTINWITKSNNNIGLPLWIIEKQSGKFLGNIVMWNIDWEIPKFEFGFWMRTSETNRGYTAEAVNALTRYCLLQLYANRIEIRCEINNIPAQQVPKHLGFELDGTLRNSHLAISNGKLTDAMIFSCINIKTLREIDVSWGNQII